ncbi:hypothetical protein C0J45_14950 [Silurus meridionalis]|nr:hypothetical protein C0J45_14950 [Silurus meridionalis]
MTDFNGHVGEGNRGDEEVMGRYGLKERNVEGQMVVDFAKRMEMAVVNTYFKKKEDHRVMYKSGGRCTQVDYVLCRRCNLKEIGDCKVLAWDSVARQHWMVICRLVLEAKKKRRRVNTERRRPSLCAMFSRGKSCLVDSSLGRRTVGPGVAPMSRLENRTKFSSEPGRVSSDAEWSGETRGLIRGCDGINDPPAQGLLIAGRPLLRGPYEMSSWSDYPQGLSCGPSCGMFGVMRYK